MFSMSQLSENPYRIVRLEKDAQLPFVVDNAEAISGLTLESLHTGGRLFFADFLDQKYQPKSAGKYSAACQAYFFIHPGSEDFLPLAIKSNTEGADLIYTPKDEANDWLLAKMMFNQNNLWYAQWYHLAGTHVVSEIVYLSAIRTLSEDHPIMSILHRCTCSSLPHLSYFTLTPTTVMKDAWAFRVIAIQRLTYAGGPVDQLFPWAGSQASNYTDALYHSGEAGAFQDNYFIQNLEKRGLVNSIFGPKLKHFPFYEDASVIHTEIRNFMTALVNSYYITPDMIVQDTELQAWISEAVPAQIIDFPSAPLKDAETLIDILTHIAHLVSVAHGTLNTNAPVASSGSLPFHPLAFYSPLPISKGVTDIMKYMPQVQASVGQIILLAAFNRPTFVDSNETIVHMFDDQEMLTRMNKKTKKAEGVFRSKMREFSEEVRRRDFNEMGLSKGMPYLWTALDPGTASYWLTI